MRHQADAGAQPSLGMMNACGGWSPCTVLVMPDATLVQHQTITGIHCSPCAWLQCSSLYLACEPVRVTPVLWQPVADGLQKQQPTPDKGRMLD